MVFNHQTTIGQTINKSKSKISSTWGSSKKYKRTKTTSVTMILVFRTKSLCPPSVKAVQVAMMISLEMKDQQRLSVKNKSMNKTPISKMSAWEESLSTVTYFPESQNR